MTNQPLSRDQLIVENYESTKKQLADCLVSYTEAVMCEDENKLQESFGNFSKTHTIENARRIWVDAIRFGYTIE